MLFQKYRVLSLLGSGSSSNVYLVEHINLQQYRALKCIPKTLARTASLYQEASLLKNLRHPGIPILYDIEEDDNYLYIFEEYIQGESLSAYMQNHDISQETIISYGIQLCDVISYLHSQKPSPVLYLDLKPAHIIVCEDRLKLIDYGVAVTKRSADHRHQSYGTRGFAAPEQYENLPLTEQTDIFGIGAILYYMQTGNSLPLNQKKSFLHLENCPIFMKKIISRSVSSKAEKRYQNVSQMREKLKKETSYRNRKISRKHLLKKIKKPNRKGGTAEKVGQTIGIMGMASGLGVTHLAIGLCSYLVREEHMRVAYVEMGGSGCVNQMSSLGNEDRFEKEGIYFYPSVLPQELNWIYGERFDYIVLDLGSDSKCGRNHLANCDRRYVLGSLSPWRKKDFFRYIEHFNQEYGNVEICYLGVCGDKIEIKKSHRTFGVQVKSIPYVSDPFQMKKELNPFFHSLL